MSRGIGKTQQAILDALADDTEQLARSVRELAEQLHLPMNQTRRAARALEARGLVAITKECTGWRGLGEYGRLQRRYSWWNSYGPEVPTALVVKEGDPWPRGHGYTTAREGEWVHGGMPTMGLLVWLPKQRLAWLEREIENTISIAHQFGGLSSEGQKRLEHKQAEADALRAT